MANTFTTQGKQRILVQALQATAGAGPTYSSARFVGQTISVDDSANAIAAGDTAANSGGAITNFFAQAQDSTSTASSTTGTIIATIPSGSGNFTIKRILVHDQTSASVTASSTTLVCGIDTQSIAKNSGFSLTLQVTVSIA